MAELVTRLEQRDADARFELFGNALEYKQRWSDELERCERSNLSIPDPRPHPDDIIVDPSNGNVRILGPQTRKQKAHYDQATARRIEAQDEVNYFAEKYRRARSEEMKERYLEGWHVRHHQRYPARALQDETGKSILSPGRITRRRHDKVVR